MNASGGGPSSDGESTAGSAGAAPIYVPSGIYDPERVYLWGTLVEGACYLDAIASVDAPSQAATGFSCSGPDGRTWTSRGITVRPSDGQVLYVHELTSGDPLLRGFVPDGNGTGEYPTDPHANDPYIDGPCDWFSWYFVHPETSQVVYECGDDYLLETGDAYGVPAGYSLLHLGFGSAQLLTTDAGDLAVSSGDGVNPVDPPLTIPTTRSASAARAHTEGFWVLQDSPDGPSPERWSIALDGSAALDGRYPDPISPSAYSWPLTEGDWTGCAFEPNGAAPCFGHNEDNILDDRILRLEFGSEAAEVVYTEAVFPRVKIHISYLFTGP